MTAQQESDGISVISQGLADFLGEDLAAMARELGLAAKRVRRAPALAQDHLTAE